MDIRAAIEGQLKAGLAMLRECIELCPDDLWQTGDHPRTFWRIAYHALYYAHLYSMKDEAAFHPWEKHQDQARTLWDDDEDGIPPWETTYSPAEMLQYLGWVQENVSSWLDDVDLASIDSGFSWYSIPKLDHMILNVRHLQGHVGQLSELLLSRGIETSWVSRVK